MADLTLDEVLDRLRALEPHVLEHPNAARAFADRCTLTYSTNEGPIGHQRGVGMAIEYVDDVATAGRIDAEDLARRFCAACPGWVWHTGRHAPSVGRWEWLAFTPPQGQIDDGG